MIGFDRRRWRGQERLRRRLPRLRLAPLGRQQFVEPFGSSAPFDASIPSPPRGRRFRFRLRFQFDEQSLPPPPPPNGRLRGGGRLCPARHGHAPPPAATLIAFVLVGRQTQNLVSGGHGRLQDATSSAGQQRPPRRRQQQQQQRVSDGHDASSGSSSGRRSRRRGSSPPPPFGGRRSAQSPFLVFGSQRTDELDGHHDG